MPAHLHLELFGSIVWDAFGTPPYLVGSVVTSQEWRDVDVRLILEDEEYERLFGPYRRPERMNGKWAALCMAFSALGKEMTGLPIDFQIQQQTQANKQYPGRREALGLVGVRMLEKPEGCE